MAGGRSGRSSRDVERSTRPGESASKLYEIGEDAPVRQIDTKDLNKHLQLIEQSTEEDRDELLRDLLVLIYPTKVSQDD